jgi:predicted regulator of Ras-like GTPase activity (Roadblock/LC7/MglB family)
MQQLIDDLKSIPGVIGAYVSRTNQGILCSNLPSLFKPERIAEVTKSLLKIHTAGKQNFNDLIEVFINYEESMLFCRQFTSRDYVMAVCDPGMNLGVLAMSLNMALEEVTGRIEAGDALPEEEPILEAVEDEPAATQQAAPPPSDAAPAPSFDQDPLAKPLEELSKSLAKILGPMALIVFDDTLAKWASGRTPTQDDLPQLVDRLCQEIEDPEKAKHFQKMVQPFLKAA